VIRLNHFSARIPTHRAVRCVLIAEADYPTVNQFCLTGQGTGDCEEEGIHGLGDFFEGGDGFFNLLDGLLELLDGLFEGFTGGGLLEPFGKVVEFFVLLVTDGFEVLPDVGKLVDEVGKLLALRAVHGLWGYAGWIGWLGIRNGRGKGYGEGEDFNIWDPDHPAPARKPGRAPAAAHYPEPAADNPEPSLPTTQLTELLKPRWTCSRIERM
jgi:hypothetical protein